MAMTQTLLAVDGDAMAARVGYMDEPAACRLDVRPALILLFRDAQVRDALRPHEQLGRRDRATVEPGHV